MAIVCISRMFINTSEKGMHFNLTPTKKKQLVFYDHQVVLWFIGGCLLRRASCSHSPDLGTLLKVTSEKETNSNPHSVSMRENPNSRI